MGNYWQILTAIIGRAVIGPDATSEKRARSSLEGQDWTLGDKVGGCGNGLGQRCCWSGGRCEQER